MSACHVDKEDMLIVLRPVFVTALVDMNSASI